MKRWLPLFFLLSGCAARGIFYFPNKQLYANPDKLGLKYELVNYPSANGKKLVALYFPAEGLPKGSVVHFHGNFGNVSNHFPQSYFLVKRGYDLLVFDYQGFGGSEGKPTPQRTVEDGLASVRYAYERRRASDGVAVLGQSLGAAVATVVAAKEPLVKAVALEAGFTRYRAITAYVMRRGWLTWPFSFIYPPLFVRREFDPEDFVASIAPRPLLFIHGDKDKTIPVGMSRALYMRAKDPKELWIVPGAGHLEPRRAAAEEYQQRLDEFFERALSNR